MSWRAFVSRNLQSIKFLCDPVAPSSEVARSYWAATHAEIKHLNPSFPYMIRPNAGGEPYIMFEYDFARRVKVDVAGLTPAQLEDKMREMVVKGDAMPRSLHQSVEPLLRKSIVE